MILGMKCFNSKLKCVKTWGKVVLASSEAVGYANFPVHGNTVCGVREINPGCGARTFEAGVLNSCSGRALAGTASERHCPKASIIIQVIQEGSFLFLLLMTIPPAPAAPCTDSHTPFSAADQPRSAVFPSPATKCRCCTTLNTTGLFPSTRSRFRSSPHIPSFFLN